MSKTEHYDKIWSRAATKNYCDGWERTFGKKTGQGRGFGPEASGGKRVQRAVTRPAKPPSDVSGASGELPKTMKALAGYLEREKANG